MKKWLFVALLVVGATVLGATVFREPIAHAAQTVDATIIGPLDRNGNVRVHEQGTADVNVSNSSVSVEQAGSPITFHLFGNGDPYLVPAGKRLLIQYINGSHSSETERLIVFVSDPFGTFRFAGQPTAGDTLVSEPVTINAGPVELVEILSQGEATFSGYLIDA